MAEVILVDMDDHPMGTAPKMKAHEEGLLHRAFSVFLFREDQLLMQKRAEGKYHSALLWSNTCCSHPKPGEEVREAAIRRLNEEMGIRTDDLKEVGSFVYRVPFSDGLIEFEYDHVLVGEYDGAFAADPKEVTDAAFLKLADVKKDIRLHPGRYTAWFITALSIAEKGR